MRNTTKFTRAAGFTLVASFTLVTVLALGFVSMAAAGPSGSIFLRGDADGNGGVDSFDLDLLAAHVGSGGSLPVPVIEALDVVDDGWINAADVAALTEQLADGTAGQILDSLDFQIGDLHRDGRIDRNDYLQLRGVVYGGARVAYADMDAADINRDGQIDSRDLRAFRTLMRHSRTSRR